MRRDISWITLTNIRQTPVTKHPHRNRPMQNHQYTSIPLSLSTQRSQSVARMLAQQRIDIRPATAVLGANLALPLSLPGSSVVVHGPLLRDGHPGSRLRHPPRRIGRLGRNAGAGRPCCPSNQRRRPEADVGGVRARTSLEGQPGVGSRRCRVGGRLS